MLFDRIWGRLVAQMALSFALALTLFLSPPANAENDTLEVGTLETTTGPTDAEQKLIGVLELRPSWETANGKNFGDNSAELGYQFRKNIGVTYKQEFTNNIYDPTTSPGFDLRASDGYFVGYLDDVWTSGSWAFSYEPRVYLPTLREKREAGFQTAIFNQLKFGNHLSEAAYIELSAAPIVHAYSQAGFEGEDGPEASPIFENQWQLLTEVTFFDGKLLLSVPIKLDQKRHGDFAAGAKFNDGWSHKLWMHPELTYQVLDNIAIGTAFMSENFIRDDFSAFRIGEGFSEGTAQIILKAEI